MAPRPLILEHVNFHCLICMHSNMAIVQLLASQVVNENLLSTSHFILNVLFSEVKNE